MVLNPLFVVPWLIVPPVCVGIAYAATAAGLIPPVYVSIPWITPPGLYAFLATGGNVMAGLVSLFNVFVGLSSRSETRTAFNREFLRTAAS